MCVITAVVTAAATAVSAVSAAIALMLVVCCICIISPLWFGKISFPGLRHDLSLATRLKDVRYSFECKLVILENALLKVSCYTRCCMVDALLFQIYFHLFCFLILRSAVLFVGGRLTVVDRQRHETHNLFHQCHFSFLFEYICSSFSPSFYYAFIIHYTHHTSTYHIPSSE